MPRTRQKMFEPSQPDNRRFTRFRDQHGRLWEGSIELDTGHPTGPLKPVGWRAPLMPPQKYFEFPRLSDGTFTINYARWISDREKAKEDFERRKINNAKLMYGEQAGEMLKKMPPELLNAVGSPPDPVEPVLAASAGNKWVLGLSPNKPEWAEAFFTGDEETTKRNNRRATDLLADLDQIRDQFPDAEDDAEVDLDELGASE